MNTSTHDLSQDCAVACGIDVSKKTLDVYILYSSKKGIHCTVPNSPMGWSDLVRRITETALKENGGGILLEATGDYHLGCAFHLSQAGFLVKVTNPFVLNSFAKMDMRKTKTDVVDSQKLAQLLIAQPDIPVFTFSSDMGIKKLARVMQTYVHVKQILTNTLLSLEDSQQASGGILDLTSHIRLIRETLHQISESVRQIEKLLADSDTMKRVIGTIGNIKGVSQKGVINIMAEIGDITRFTNKHQLTAYCGLDPSIRTSGISVRGRSRISKRGSPTLRKALTQAGWGLMMHDPASRVYYEKKRKEGKHYFTCLVALARQFIIHLWAALRKGEQYRPACVQAVV